MSAQNLQPVATTIFCDDLRQEVGNKISYMGVYQGAMFVLDFPLVLPKFCAAVTLRYPRDTRPKSITFRMFRDDELLAERTMPIESRQAGIDLADAAHAVIYATVFFQFTPFTADAQGQLRSRIYIDDEELKAGGLEIRRLSNA